MGGKKQKRKEITIYSWVFGCSFGTNGSCAFKKTGNLSRLQSLGYIYIPVITTKSLEVNQTSPGPIKVLNESPVSSKPLPHAAVKESKD